MAPLTPVAAVVVVTNTVSPGLKSLAGFRARVLPLTVAVPRAPSRSSPPRCWLNTRTAPSVAAVFCRGCESVTATLAVAAAARWLRVGARPATASANTVKLVVL